MAISVKDIQEKEFSVQASNGYNVEQVDDFLDELAEQLGMLIRENLALNSKAKQLEEELAAAKAAKAEAEKKLPDYNESSYFQNLQTTMREALIGAQRIADETVAEASKKAEMTIADANAQAEKTVADANAQAEKTVADATAQAEVMTASAVKAAAEMKAETDRLQAVAQAYVTNFKAMVEEQLKAITANEELLK